MSKNRGNEAVASETAREQVQPFTWPSAETKKEMPPPYHLMVILIGLIVLLIALFPGQILSGLGWLANSIILVLFDFSGWLSRTFLGSTW